MPGGLRNSGSGVSGMDEQGEKDEAVEVTTGRLGWAFARGLDFY